MSSGVNINNLRYEALARLPVPVPPLAEQRRLVALIERYFSRLNAGITALRRAQTKLQRYRMAVLHAAVTGQLVAQNPADEPAPALLRRLLTERDPSGQEALFEPPQTRLRLCRPRPS